MAGGGGGSKFSRDELFALERRVLEELERQ